MKFRVWVWCKDCNGIDPYGCFDGGGQFFEEDDPPFGPKLYDTREEAQAAIDADQGPPWVWEIEEVVP